MSCPVVQFVKARSNDPGRRSNFALSLLGGYLSRHTIERRLLTRENGTIRASEGARQFVAAPADREVVYGPAALIEAPDDVKAQFPNVDWSE